MSAINEQQRLGQQEHPNFVVMDYSDYSSSDSSSDLEEGAPTKAQDDVAGDLEKPKVRHWYSRHPQVYYGICGHYECVPAQCVDILLDALNILPVIFGIVWYNDCESIETLTPFLITVGCIYLSLGVLNFIFRVPKLGGMRGKRDDSYLCSRVLGLAGLTACLASAVWGGIIIFPNIAAYFSRNSSHASSSTTTTTGTGTLLNDHHHFQCKSILFTSAMVMTIINIVVLLIVAICIVVCVIIQSRNAKKNNAKKNAAAAENAEEEKRAADLRVAAAAAAVPNPSQRYLFVAEEVQPSYQATQNDGSPNSKTCSSSTVAASEVFHNGAGTLGRSQDSFDPIATRWNNVEQSQQCPMPGHATATPQSAQRYC